MTRYTRLIVNVLLLILSITLLITTIAMIANNISHISITELKWIIVGIVLILIISAVLFGIILKDISSLKYEKQVKSMLKQDYTRLYISDLSCVPFCIKTALDMNNIVFYGRYRITQKGYILICIIATKDDNFFAEEILSERGPFFMSPKDFLNTFEV